MPALPRRFVIWFSLHYSKPESFSDAVLDKCDQKQDIRNEAYMAKLFADEMSFRVVDRVLQIHGGIGLTLDLPLAKWFVDQRSRMITEGASEVMRMVIAREVLKKYN